MSLFVFGLGYSARAAVRAFRAADPALAVAGTTRTPDSFQAMQTLGVTPHIFTGEAPGETLGHDLAAATVLLVSVAPGPVGDPVLDQHRGDILAAAGLSQIIYLSTIGVYGDADGAWIDEDYPVPGSSERAHRRVIAEAGWRHLADQTGAALAVLRLAGIYGPGRSNFDRLREGTAQRIVKPGQVFNRIHCDDIGRVAALAAAQRLDGVFNVTDDLPAPPQEVMAHAAALIGVPPPPEIAFDTAALSPMARAFYADNKRVSNRRLKSALGIDLLYPTYREGLAAVLAAERSGQQPD